MTLRSHPVLQGIACLIALLDGYTAHAQSRVSDSVHNLSASGPGVVRAVSEQQVCIFCHAPHNTKGIRPLWNRDLPPSSYTIYESSTLDANPGQPTGASKLCLSCHDGTIALGSVLSRADQIRMTGGDFMPSGLTNLGTDLSDDHPVSFFYTAGLAASDLQLASPQALPPEVRLDESGQLQCTACHSPHNNQYGKFLVMRNEFGALCTTCHVMNGWVSSSHRNSPMSVTGFHDVIWPYDTVAENACQTCHRSHTAGGRERLLIFENEEDNCLCCHDRPVAGTNILAAINKISAHDPRRYFDVHDPTETPSVNQTHVECADCHNAHAVRSQPPIPGYIPIGTTMLMVKGITIGGSPVDEAQYEYEVCFRCHGDSPVEISGRVPRLSQTANLRLRFAPTNPSFHPVATSVSSLDTVSLVPGLSPGSMIRCTDCHNNDSGGGPGGGSTAGGPHGSIYDFLLELNYTVSDDTPESEYEYAICYKCHERLSILSDQSFSEHQLHIQEKNTPCSACHDPHGISTMQTTGSDHTHLINFDTVIVRTLDGFSNPRFEDRGHFAGSCTLLCHGIEHNDKSYPGE